MLSARAFQKCQNRPPSPPPLQKLFNFKISTSKWIGDWDKFLKIDLIFQPKLLFYISELRSILETAHPIGPIHMVFNLKISRAIPIFLFIRTLVKFIIINAVYITSMIIII